MEKRVGSALSYRSARTTVRGRFMFMWLTQIVLTALLLNEQCIVGLAQYAEVPDQLGITLSRFLCGAVMHFTL